MEQREGRRDDRQMALDGGPVRTGEHLANDLLRRKTVEAAERVAMELEQRVTPIVKTILAEHPEMFGSIRLNFQRGRLINVNIDETRKVPA